METPMNARPAPDPSERPEEPLIILEYSAVNRVVGSNKMESGAVSATKKWMLAAVLLALAVPSGFGADEEQPPVPPEEGQEIESSAEPMDILATLKDDGGLNTLVTFLEEAGLDSLIGGPGPFTLFAPDDSAFAQLAPDELEQLFSDSAALASLLRHHLVPDTEFVFEELGESVLVTAAGDEVTVRADYEEVTVDEAVVLEESIWCSNGVIHVIDAVLMPRKAQTKE